MTIGGLMLSESGDRVLAYWPLPKGWVSVKDAFPDTENSERWVIVTGVSAIDPEDRYVEIAYHDDGVFFARDGDEELNQPTHWAWAPFELPEAYES